MRLLRRSLGLKDVSLQMTPMIDVVFLLLIFFLCVAEMRRIDAEALTLPVAHRARPEEGERGDRLVVNVLRSGEYRVAGAGCAPAALERLIGARAAALADAEGRPAMAVKIRADADAPYKRVQTVMTACAKARVWKISFAAAPADRPETTSPLGQ